jgi:hypothetical protein
MSDRDQGLPVIPQCRPLEVTRSITCSISDLREPKIDHTGVLPPQRFPQNSGLLLALRDPDRIPVIEFNGFAQPNELECIGHSTDAGFCQRRPEGKPDAMLYRARFS